MDWMELIEQIVMYVLALLVALICRAALTWLNAKKATEESRKEETEENTKWTFLCFVTDIVNAVVNQVGQVMVAGIKGTEAWTEEAKTAALQAARTQIELVLGDSGMERLTGWLGDAESWMVSKIEAAVLKNKDRWTPAVVLLAEEEGEKDLSAPEPQISDAAYERATYENTV